MPGPIFEMVESTRGGGERNDPSSVNVSRFPDRNFDRIKEIVIYSVSLVRRYTYGYPIFSSFSTGSRQTFPRQIRFGAFLTGTGARCRVFREQTFAKPVKLASHFKVKSGSARGGTIDPN